MEYDIATLPPGDAYRLVTNLVVPRPIALVTTTGEDGLVNAAPFSFFNILGSDPPVIALGISRSRNGEKDTGANIARLGEWVVNLVSFDLADKMNVTAIEFPRHTSELAAAGLTPAPSVVVGPPRVAECAAALECRHAQTVTVGNNKIVLGEVVHVHIADTLLDSEGRFLPDRYDVIGRMGGGGGYVRTGAGLFDLPRLTLAQWQDKP